MMVSNARSIDAGLRTTRPAMLSPDTELRESERVLAGVTAAVGVEREQVARIVGDLSAIEREMDRAREKSVEIDELQAEIDRSITDAKTLTSQEVGSMDIEERKQAFLDALRKYLIELRHSEITDNNAARLTFDEQYVPYFDDRRLRSLGSASDHPRLTTAYTLALAATGTRPTGLHPSIVILDEPLQQNPDPGHRSRFVQFLCRELARTAAFQTIIFTSLKGEEVARFAQTKRERANTVRKEMAEASSAT
ncbi:MAG: hypothetical protein ABSH56_32660 [Bryobacteraceae bacterium]|jgi:hypothetical protein